jgi:hypothetical protein
MAAHGAEADTGAVPAPEPQASAASREASPAETASLAPAGSVQPELQTVANVELPAAGICPVIDELVQQSCAQYPSDPGCTGQ